VESKGCAIITGASGGIGESLAKLLAAAGHSVLLVARNEAKLKSLCEQIRADYGTQASYLVKDLSKPESSEVDCGR